MINQPLHDRVNAMIQEYRNDTIAFAAAFEQEHDKRAYEHLASKVPQSGLIKNDTPRKLKERATEPGAFFNKRMRPIPFGPKY